MWGVRFHGRGGHGTKTASRILGTAAFLSGLQAQDSPVYGAERRGAPLTAFTRIDTQPIRERGAVVDPCLSERAESKRRLNGILNVPPGAKGVVTFAHGSGNGPFRPRNQVVPRVLQEAGLATLVINLLETSNWFYRHSSKRKENQ